MGLTVSVMCGCFAEGKVDSPFPGQVQLDEEGYIHLNLPREGHKEEHILFLNWLDSGCEHPRMVYASDVINWTAYRSFQQALARAGWEHFPTLKAELPDNGNKTTPANAASAMLAELSFFAERADLGWTTVLVDTDIGFRAAVPLQRADGQNSLLAGWKTSELSRRNPPGVPGPRAYQEAKKRGVRIGLGY